MSAVPVGERERFISALREYEHAAMSVAMADRKRWAETLDRKLAVVLAAYDAALAAPTVAPASSAEIPELARDGLPIDGDELLREMFPFAMQTGNVSEHEWAMVDERLADAAPASSAEMRPERGEALETFLREVAACGVAWRKLPAIERALNTYLLDVADRASHAQKASEADHIPEAVKMVGNTTFVRFIPGSSDPAPPCPTPTDCWKHGCNRKCLAASTSNDVEGRG